MTSQTHTNNKHISPDSSRIGLLLTNIGSPQAPTPRALRKYLKEFLSDARIIDWPRWIWLPILHTIILTFRPRRSARLYQNVWTSDGSPLLFTLERQARLLTETLAAQNSQDIAVEIGMRYGSPSIAAGLRSLRKQGVGRILVLPLFPQYSSTTTASTLDAVFDELKTWWALPELRTVNSYHDHPTYINALAHSIQARWSEHGQPEKLLFSFHGVPARFNDTGDPYLAECLRTSRLVAHQLDLPDSAWHTSFQSRFGPEPWLQPYTDATLHAWGAAGLSSVNVVCPGFSADCLETLDEIDREARESFIHAGGKEFAYIPALNDQAGHIAALAAIASSHMQDWVIQPARQPELQPV
ncbi:MAG: ferrochelatase [Anaerolineae bacterium]|nr:ferrochelatase [Anaerolineae bacterium]